MSDATHMAGPNQATGRPSYSNLLYEPIASDPRRENASYDDWEFDHGGLTRFYVGGLRWFMRAVGIYEISRLAHFAPAAVRMAKAGTEWTMMPDSGDRWDSCSINQFRTAKAVGPLFFQKAALVILSCEMALAEALKDKEIVGVRRPEDLYRHMSIIPACWSIEDFDKAFVRQLVDAYPHALTDLVGKIGQPSKAFIDDIASGRTMSSVTAYALKARLDADYPKVGCGPVSVKTRGRNRPPASALEVIDAG